MIHIFQDGNKRTGLESALLFLKLNNYKLKEDLGRIKFELKEIPKNGETTKQILYIFTIEMASGEINLKESGLWFEANIEKMKWNPAYNTDYTPYLFRGLTSTIA